MQLYDTLTVYISKGIVCIHTRYFCGLYETIGEHKPINKSQSAFAVIPGNVVIFINIYMKTYMNLPYKGTQASIVYFGRTVPFQLSARLRTGRVPLAVA